MTEREHIEHLIAKLPSDQRARVNDFAGSLREGITNAGLIQAMYALRLVIAEMEEALNEGQPRN